MIEEGSLVLYVGEGRSRDAARIAGSMNIDYCEVCDLEEGDLGVMIKYISMLDRDMIQCRFLDCSCPGEHRTLEMYPFEIEEVV